MNTEYPAFHPNGNRNGSFADRALSKNATKSARNKEIWQGGCPSASPTRRSVLKCSDSHCGRCESRYNKHCDCGIADYVARVNQIRASTNPHASAWVGARVLRPYTLIHRITEVGGWFPEGMTGYAAALIPWNALAVPGWHAYCSWRWVYICISSRWNASSGNRSSFSAGMKPGAGTCCVRWRLHARMGVLFHRPPGVSPDARWQARCGLLLLARRASRNGHGNNAGVCWYGYGSSGRTCPSAFTMVSSSSRFDEEPLMLLSTGSRVSIFVTKS